MSASTLFYFLFLRDCLSFYFLFFCTSFIAICRMDTSDAQIAFMSADGQPRS